MNKTVGSLLALFGCIAGVQAQVVDAARLCRAEHRAHQCRELFRYVRT